METELRKKGEGNKSREKRKITEGVRIDESEESENLRQNRFHTRDQNRTLLYTGLNRRHKLKKFILCLKKHRHRSLT